MSKYTPKTKDELIALVEDETIHLGDINTSNITDMSELFLNSTRKDFSGIEKWDTSNVENMIGMFVNCENFNQPLNDWNVSNVKDMSSMFFECKNFNQPLDTWDVSNVTNMCQMFYECKKFNQPLDTWDVSNVEDMSDMLFGCKINKEQALMRLLKKFQNQMKMLVS